MEQIYYGVAIVVYGLFIVRFILSWICGDFELDADADLDMSDVVSFKGALHFIMGLSGWLSVKSLVSTVQWYDYIIGFVVGLIFIVILFFVYKVMTELENKPLIISGEGLVGREGTIYLNQSFDGDNFHYLVTTHNGVGTTEVSAKSKNKYNVGDKVILNEYKNSYYLI